MKPTTESNLGRVIRERRTARKMTLHQLGEAARLDVSQLSKIERGLCLTSPDAYDRIAIALGWTSAAMWRVATRRSAA